MIKNTQCCEKSQNKCDKIKLVSVTKKGDNTIMKMISVKNICKHGWER